MMYAVSSAVSAKHTGSINDSNYLFPEDALGGALLTPDPDPDSKFAIQNAKPGDYHVGPYDNGGCFGEYNSSGTSSSHLGVGNGVSEKEENNHDGDEAMSSRTSYRSSVTPNAELCVQNHSHRPGTQADQTDHSKLDPKIDPNLDASSTGREYTTANEGALSPIQQQLLDQDDHDGFDAKLANPPYSLTSSPAIMSLSSKKSIMEYKTRTSIPMRLSWQEFARQGVVAAYSSILNPYALHPSEFRLLKSHITLPQVTVYLNIRNAILRLWHRNPSVAVTRQEAAGCARESRHFNLALVAYEWLLRSGYINFGCVDVPDTAGPVERGRGRGKKRQTIVVIGAGVSGLGCARQLEAVISQLGFQFTQNGLKPPKVIVLEGRNRVGGRVYSHPLKCQAQCTLPNKMRSTAEMGAQIVTGFEHGNPLNFIVRGQLALPYYSLRDKFILYDHDGSLVDRDRDKMVERLWNDILERVAMYRNKLPTVQVVSGDWTQIRLGEDPKENPGEEDELLSTLEESGKLSTIVDGNPLATNTNTAENSSVGVEKLAGRQYHLSGTSATKSTAAEVAKSLGWELKSHIEDSETLNLLQIKDGSAYPTLGDAMDEGIRQYQKMLNLTEQDLRLLNWHHANLEYANGTNINELSLSGWDQDAGNEFEGEHAEIIGGYTQVPRGLYQLPNPLDVRFGCSVNSIKYKTNPHSNGSAATIKCHNGQIFEADRVVLTSSLGVLKHGSIKFKPSLPEWKSQCIERMGFGLLNKIVLVYDEAFWDEGCDMFGLLNRTNLDQLDQKSYSECRGRFYHFWNCTSTAGQPMLIALMAGTAAHGVESSNNACLVKAVTSRLAQMFAPKSIPQPRETIITRWKQDPFARGSYSYVGPRTQSGDYDTMALPVGPIHFAGEATNGTHPATVHGAYLSGLRAAAEVIEELLGPVKIPESPLVRKRKQPPGSEKPHRKKRKFGYIDVWEPIDPPVGTGLMEPLIGQGCPPLGFNTTVVTGAGREIDEQIAQKIEAKLGPRPEKPDKGIVNPFLLYQTEQWATVKARCDAQKAIASNPVPSINVLAPKASRKEIRQTIGLDWRNSSEDVKKLYYERCDKERAEWRTRFEKWKEEALRWEAEAEMIRQELLDSKEEATGASTSASASAMTNPNGPSPEEKKQEGSSN